MIRAVWESPTNEGTSYYELGRKHRQIPGSYNKSVPMDHEYEWEVGRIIVEPSITFGLDFGVRVIVIDSNGKRRVSLPAKDCAWEWLPSEEESCCGEHEKDLDFDGENDDG